METVIGKLRWIFLSGFFLILLLPLFNLPPWLSPPAWGQSILFRMIVSFMMFVVLWYILFHKEGLRILEGVVERVKSVRVVFSLAVAFFFVLLLSTIFSADLSFSFWGDPLRAGGFLNLFFFLLFALLAFLFIQDRDWNKVWNAAIFGGILVSLVAILQQFQIFDAFFISSETRPPATVGGAIFLGTYLLLLTFIALVFLLRERDLKKKLVYGAALFLLLFVVFLSGSRSAYIGLFVGLLYFLFLYPLPKEHPLKIAKRLLALKTIAVLVLFVGAYSIYFYNIHPDIIIDNSYLKTHPNLQVMAQGLASRFSLDLALQDPRPSGWKIALHALKEKPLLGYGPENFSVGFDRFYDSSLPHFEVQDLGVGTNWWDKAHNFVLDIGVANGIPALLLYISLFVVLFHTLQRIKKSASKEQGSARDMNPQNPSKSLFIHGIQATLIAYFVGLLFTFDTFSTSLIAFLLVAYSLFLISRASTQGNLDQRMQSKIQNIHRKLVTYKLPIIGFFSLLLLLFVWTANIKPLSINTHARLARLHIEKQDCAGAITRMEKALSWGSTFLDSYVKLAYVDYLTQCNDLVSKKDKAVLTQKGLELLSELVQIRPTYTRNWVFLGGFTTILLEQEVNAPARDEKRIEQLTNEAYAAFQKAQQLSPRRQEIYVEWIKTDLVAGFYLKAKEKSEKCIALNPALGHCWFFKGLSEIYLGDLEKAQLNIQRAAKEGYQIDSRISLNRLAKAYIVTQNHTALVLTYSQLIQLDPTNAQYHASLATTYKELGQFEKARQEAFTVLELDPTTKADVEKFLQELP